MNKVNGAIDFIVEVSYFENKYQTKARECIGTIKQALKDKDKRIKELQESLIEGNQNVQEKNHKLETKLNTIEEVLESENPMSYRLAMIRELLRSDKE